MALLSPNKDKIEFSNTTEIREMDEISPRKQLTINLVASVTAFLVNIGISFFLTPYITQTIGAEAYGFVSLGSNFINYASLVTIALNSMAGRFITIEIHKNNWKAANKYFNSVLLSNFIIAGIMILPSVLCIAFIDRIVNVPGEILTDVRILFAFLFANYLISLIVSTFGVATFTTNKLYLSSKRQIESSIIKAALLLVVFTLFKPAVSYLGLAAFIVMIYTAFFNMYYLRKLLPEIKFNKEYFDKSAVFELMTSGFWNSFTKLSTILATGMDLLISNLFINAFAMGSLAVAKTIPTVISSLFAVMANVFAPQLTIYYAKGDAEGMKRYLLFSIKILGIFACIPIVLLFAYGDFFYKLWMPSLDAELLYVLSILTSVTFIFNLPLEPLWNIFTITNKVKTSSIILFIESIIALAVVFLLINKTTDLNTKLYIITGISSGLSMIRTLTFLPIYGAYCLNLKWTTFYPPLIKNTLSLIILTSISLWIKKYIYIESWVFLLGISCLIIVISLIFNFLIVLEKKEKLMVKEWISEKIKK